jgi:choline dehydrogenase-like flavoprotein
VTRHDEILTPERVSGELPEHVDVIVVGAGAAGCAMAARISETPDCRVLLMEAGSTTGLEPDAQTPGGCHAAVGWSDILAGRLHSAAIAA